MFFMKNSFMDVQLGIVDIESSFLAMAWHFAGNMSLPTQ